MNSTREIPFLYKFTITLVLLFLLAGIIYIGQDIIVPLAFSILLAVLLLPMNKFLERNGIPRVISIIISLTVSIIIIAGIFYFLATQISAFVEDIPTIKKQLDNHFRTMQKWVYQQFHLTRREQTQILSDATEKMKDSGSGVVSQKVLYISQTLILIPVYGFLLLYYRDMIRKFLIDVFSKEHEENVKEVLRESRTIVQNYMIGLLIELAIIAAINSTGFLILGVEYAIFLGVLAALLNMIPYIGMLIAAVFCMLVTLTTSSNISDVIWVGVILVIVQFIDNNIIMPKVVSSQVKINALFSIIGVLIGSALAGVSGMFLSIPTIAIMKVIFDRVDGLKPWGMLLGDEITIAYSKKIYKRISSISHKKKGREVEIKSQVN